MTVVDLVPEPHERLLRIFALDPSIAAQHDTAGIGEITVPIQWEQDLHPGPVGEYIEVVDADPASGCFYCPVDLNDKRIIAQDGLPPSETNPQFHQQMVYAVAMATIAHFEQALGRVALWSSHREHDKEGRIREHFVRRLRIYPHALRERNAYYSPDKKALLFGYFPAAINDATSMRDTLIFTALSHDIIAHETTHALLDGVHPRFNEAVNEDVLAFHEAFADIVALFQHFSYPGVLRYQIAHSRGDLSGDNLLAQLAQQFGRAAGRGGALRDALGKEVDGKWQPTLPRVDALATEYEPHGRGAILVAAVFGAFLKVYQSRTADLYRIASMGTGVLPVGAIHPDLSHRLADEAARTAQYVLQMCIRALDYCPPVGITFGNFLRALITADFDLNQNDPYGYRIAMVESFLRWGIHPAGIRSTSIEALLWPEGDTVLDECNANLPPDAMEALFTASHLGDEEWRKKTEARPYAKQVKPDTRLAWDLESDRYTTWVRMDSNAGPLWGWLVKGKGSALLPALGIVTDERAPLSVYRSRTTNAPAVEIHSVRTAMRRDARGTTFPDIVVEVTQRRRGYFDIEKQKKVDAEGPEKPEKEPDFVFRAGCTMLIDPIARTIRRIIRTPGTNEYDTEIAKVSGTIVDDGQLRKVRQFRSGENREPADSFWPVRHALAAREPFALLHNYNPDTE